MQVEFQVGAQLGGRLEGNAPLAVSKAVDDRLTHAGPLGDGVFCLAAAGDGLP
jgi:hypothetical protein